MTKMPPSRGAQARPPMSNSKGGSSEPTHFSCVPPRVEPDRGSRGNSAASPDPLREHVGEPACGDAGGCGCAMSWTSTVSSSSSWRPYNVGCSIAHSAPTKPLQQLGEEALQTASGCKPSRVRCAVECPALGEPCPGPGDDPPAGSVCKPGKVHCSAAGDLGDSPAPLGTPRAACSPESLASKSAEACETDFKKERRRSCQANAWGCSWAFDRFF
mmetsp:Transcript_47248/g.119657  ORF Transcript_47248/g.119657 Transcript_47248/m.119657 type:complete len:215 (-) Transcript_47248:163-807(-)